MSDKALREAICEVGRRLSVNRLVAATDGNISARLDNGNFLSTPSGIPKGDMRPEDLVEVDAQGRVLSGGAKVTSEIFTHLAAYEARPDISAVVHAHPPIATALTIAGIDMTIPIVPEVIMGLKAIPTAAYATPGSAEGADVVREPIAAFDAILLDHHGALTVGRSPMDAYLKMEKVEHTAQTLWAAYTLGTPRRLSEEQVAKLMLLHAKPGDAAPDYPY